MGITAVLDNFVLVCIILSLSILALFLIAVIFRLIAKVIFKTFFEERSKYYEHKNKTRKSGKTQK